MDGAAAAEFGTGAIDQSPSPDASAEIARLDPETDFGRIVYLLAYQLFPWDIERALELALFKTYASPSISGLLSRTGEFETRPRKRYDDTELILNEIAEHGLDSARGARAIARMNAMHGRYRISNEDFVYVLSTFVFEPIEWMAAYGRRPLTEREQTAWLRHYQGLGRRMGMDDIPETLAAFAAFRARYEEERFVFAESNRRVAEATLDLVVAMYLPKPLVRFGRPVMLCLTPAPLIAALGFAPPPYGLRRAVIGAMALRRRLLRLLPERRRLNRGTLRRRPTYPEGYAIEELGVFAPPRCPMTGASSSPNRPSPPAPLS